MKVILANLYPSIFSAVWVLASTLLFFSFVIGLEFRDSHLVITPKSNAKFSAGMTVNLNIGFTDLDNPEAASKVDRKFSLWLGDVVVVRESEAAEVLTVAAKKRMKSVRFVVKDDDDEEEEAEENGNEGAEELLGRGHRRAILQSKTRVSCRLSARIMRRSLVPEVEVKFNCNPH